MIKYNAKEYLESINENELSLIKQIYLNSIHCYKEDYSNVVKTTSYKLKRSRMLVSFIYIWINELLDFINKSDVTSNFLNNLYDFNKGYFNINLDLFNLKNSDKRLMFNFFNLISEEFEKVCFEFFLESNKDYILNAGNVVIKIEELKIVHLLSKHISNINFIAKNTRSCAVNIIKKHGIKVNLNQSVKDCIYNQKTRLNLDNDINIIDLRLLFYCIDYIPSTKIIKDFLENKLLSNMKNYIIFPLFLRGSSLIFNSKNHGYFKIYFEYKSFYDQIIKDFISCSLEYKLKILIPNIMDYSVYLKWRLVIKQLSAYNCIDVGILLDDFYTIEDIIKFKQVELIYIDLDKINSNNFNIDLNNIYLFKEHFIEELRCIRDFSNDNGIDLLIHSNKLTNTVIVEKLLILGYKKISLNSKINNKNIEIFRNYMERTGKYAKKT